MKRILILVLSAAAAAVSCNIYDSENDIQEPAYIIAQDAYSDYVSSVFNAAELADFFLAYQEIRTDRQSALELADSYFGEYYVSKLFYEEAYILNWGTIFMREDGSLYTAKNYYPDICLEVEQSSPRHFTIYTKQVQDDEGNWYYPDAVELTAEVSCDDSEVTIESLNIRTSTLSIRSVDGAPLKKPIISSLDEMMYLALSGELEFEYNEDTISDKFTFELDGDYVLIKRAGETVTCKRFDKWLIRRDYVITR